MVTRPSHLVPAFGVASRLPPSSHESAFDISLLSGEAALRLRSPLASAERARALITACSTRTSRREIEFEFELISSRT